jgi:CDP-diglyceride synthetase
MDREMMSGFVFAAVVLGLAVLGLVGSYFVIRKNKRSGRRSVWSYVLLWPLLFERERPEGGGLFTKREPIGWGLLLLLIALAVTFGL